MAESGQRAGAPFQMAQGHVVEDQGAVAQVLVGETALDPALALEQPVEHVEQLVAGHGPELQQSAQAGVGRVRGEASGGGELGVGAEDAGDDGGEGQIAHAAGGLVQHAFEAQRPAGAEDSGDVAMRQGAADGDGLLEAGEGNAAAEQSAEAGDDPGGQVGEVGDGFAANALAVAPSLAEEDGRGAVAVGDGFDVEGHGAGITWKQNSNCGNLFEAGNLRDFRYLRSG